MTTITTDLTLSELVTRHPALAASLEAQGLDYCCHGERTLDQACAASGLDATAVAAQLSTDATDEPPAEWASMGVVELVDHIESTHHHLLDRELPRLSALLDKINNVHGGRHPELADVQAAFEQLRADFEPHLRDEELAVFPAVRALAVATTPPPGEADGMDGALARLRTQHDEVGELLEKLRALTSDYRTPDDGCGSYRAAYDGLAAVEADTHLHVHKENNVLFPAVERITQRLASAGS